MAYDAMGGRGLDGSGALQRPRRGNLAAGPFVRSDLCTVETARAADRMSPVPTAGGLKAP